MSRYAPLCGLLALSCSDPPSAPAPATPEPAAPAPPAPAPAAPATPEPAAPAPTGQSLVMLAPVEQGCALRRLNIDSGASADLALFSQGCVGGRVYWAPDASRALVWFDPRAVYTHGYGSANASPPRYEAETPDFATASRFLLVTLATGEVRELPAPAGPGELERVGLDGGGRILALTLESLEEDRIVGGAVQVDGQAVAIPEGEEGLPALAHALSLEGEAWRRIESAATTTGWDYAGGTGVLQAARGLGQSSVELLSSRGGLEPLLPEQAVVLATQRPANLGPDDGEWGRTLNEGAPLFAWQVVGEFTHFTGLMRWGEPPAPLPGLEFTDGELVGLQLRGPLILVAGSEVGTHPRLYDARTRRLVFSSDEARAVTFWPVSGG